MKAHLVQLSIEWESKKANFERVLGLLEGSRVSPGDLVLLPEMFDTGFSMNTGITADGGETLAFLCEVAARFGVTVQGGRTLARAGAKAANVMTVVAEVRRGSSAPGERGLVGAVDTGGTPVPRGEVICEYQKIHPFSLGREHEHFEGGSEVKTYRWGEGAEATTPTCAPADSVGEVQAATHPPPPPPPKTLSGSKTRHLSREARERSDERGGQSLVVCPAICYDLRFPELFRRGLAMGAEVFAVGACWPKARQHHWRALLIARAIENQAYALGVNRVGADPVGTNGAPGQALEYVGGSIAVSPTGEVVGELGAEEAVLSVEIDAGVMRRWREKFPAWRDRRM